MVAKNKRLRDKASSRSKQNSSSQSDITQHIENELTAFLKPQSENERFLHQYKETKKDKLENKSLGFKEKIMKSSLDGIDNLSKSAVRRRKRKLKEELKPKMNDLLDSLQNEGFKFEKTTEKDIATTTDSTATKSTSSVTRVIDNTKKQSIIDVSKLMVTNPTQSKDTSFKNKTAKKNEPSIRTQKGSKFLQEKETSHFKQVLATPQFQTNTFSALREVIAMKQQQEQQQQQQQKQQKPGKSRR